MNILITGANKGIGKEVVIRFAENPEHNIVAIARDYSQLEELKSYCGNKFKNSIHIYKVDFLSDTFQDDIALIHSELNIAFDVIINNAGMLINKPFKECSIKEVTDTYKVNVFAPIEIIKQFTSTFAKEHKCHIINIGSMGGFQGSAKFPGLSIYSSSKSALANLTECLAEEFKESAITINCLALGSVQTEMLNNAFPGYKAQLTPLQMAEYIVQFSLQNPVYINGKIIPVSNSTP